MLIVAGRLFTPGSASGDNGQWARRRASIAVRILGQPPCSATAFLPSRTAPTRAAEIKTKSFRDAYLAYLKSRVNMGKIKSKLKRAVVVDDVAEYAAAGTSDIGTA